MFNRIVQSLETLGSIDYGFVAVVLLVFFGMLLATGSKKR